MARLMALVVVAALLGAAVAQPTSPTAADCDRSVKHCSTCRYQFFRGTTTKAICTKCETGYLPKASGRACYCAPGYFTNMTTSVAGNVGFTCYPCGAGSYCPGSKITAASSTARAPCGANKQTTTEYAMSELECTVVPGYGWATGDGSAACDIGMYNPGFNARKCTPCPGGLTTVATKSQSSQECMAGVGFYYLRGKAVACARGTYKNYVGNQDCDKCPTGISTANTSVSADVKEKCVVLLPGYALTATPTLGETNATECPVNTYRSGEATFDGTTGAQPCTPCPDGLVTLPNTTRATTLDACVVPPGSGWNATGSTSAGSATPCPIGSYNPGYNRQPCASCGTQILTDAPGAENADACYTASGWGNVKDAATGALTASICPIGTYGRPNNTYGLVDVECTKCMDHSTTNTTGANSQAACLVEPGYGWNDGQVLECEYGYYNEGFNQRLCTYCGDGYNTSATVANTFGEMKSTAASTCQVDFGYFIGASAGVEACLRGHYKDVLGTAACTTCPMGTSTTKASAGLLKSDCDTCRPGFGILGAKVNLADPKCDMCLSGTYSSGFVAYGQECAACPATANFTGKMVSRPGIFTPEDCYGEYTTDAAVFDNQQAWDLIPMALGSTLVIQAATSVSDCQIACSGSVNCQYFAFYKTGGPDLATNGGNNQCYFRLSSVAQIVKPAPTNWDAPADPLVAFEIREGQYVVYSAVAGEAIGVPIAGAATSLMLAKGRCDADRTCVGIQGDSTGWTLFGAVQREDAIGKIRVTGENIQPWVPLPTGL